MVVAKLLLLFSFIINRQSLDRSSSRESLLRQMPKKIPSDGIRSSLMTLAIASREPHPLEGDNTQAVAVAVTSFLEWNGDVTLSHGTSIRTFAFRSFWVRHSAAADTPRTKDGFDLYGFRIMPTANRIPLSAYVRFTNKT